jgi:uncharacterized membrane protein (TIGR02234 family)
MAEPRRTFGPVVLVGLASAGLAALAGNRTWATFDQASDGASGSPIGVSLSTWPEAPLVSALAFVVLAAWGVLLVTRGRFRRGVAVLAVLASVGMLVAAAVVFASTAGDLVDAFDQVGVEGRVNRTSWPFVALVAGLVSVAATVAAVRLAPGWPEMGSRYDAPGAAPPPNEQTGIDLWKALDEGRDPTLPREPRTDP